MDMLVVSVEPSSTLHAYTTEPVVFVTVHCWFSELWIPSRVRCDHGLENAGVARSILYKRRFKKVLLLAGKCTVKELRGYGQR